MTSKGIIGLTNRGNTCYLNTSIQILSNVPLLTQYFLSNDEYLEDINNNFNNCNKNKKRNEIKIAEEYAKLIKALWTSNTPIEPRSFHELIQKVDTKFSGFDQHDAQEVLSLILDNLHEGLKYDVEVKYDGQAENLLDEIMIESINNWKNNLQNKYSIVGELFFGQFINKIISLDQYNKNQLVSKTFELFSMLNIPIYGETLHDSLQKYFEKEVLETKYFDEKNNKHIDAYKQIKMMKVPKYLIIVLKRYKNTINGNSAKVNNLITFPIDNLDLSIYSEGYESIECSAKLISVSYHKGNVLNGGHYYAICRNKNDKWYKFNDNNVNEFDLNMNKNSFFKDAYILIYEKTE